MLSIMKMLQTKSDGVIKKLNCVNTNEIAYHLHNMFENKARLDRSLSRGVPLPHVHRLEPPGTCTYHTTDHSQHAKIIYTCNTKNIKDYKAS